MLVLGMLFMIPFLSVEARSTRPPTFEDHFAKPLIEWKTADGQWTERVFNIASVSRDKDIRENIEALFFPKWNGGVLREILKYVGYFLVFIAIVMAATKLVVSAKKPDDLKNALASFTTILVGSALYFWVVWIFSTLIKIPGINQTWGLRDTVISGSGLLFFVMSLLKAGAFFYAIVMIVWTGFQMMNPTSGEKTDDKSDWSHCGIGWSQGCWFPLLYRFSAKFYSAGRWFYSDHCKVSRISQWNGNRFDDYLCRISVGDWWRKVRKLQESKKYTDQYLVGSREFVFLPLCAVSDLCWI